MLVGRQLPAWADAERWPALPFPSDAIARRVFLARMGEAGSVPNAPARTAANLVRERVIDLVAAIPIELLDTLPPSRSRASWPRCARSKRSPTSCARRYGPEKGKVGQGDK